MNWTIHWEQSWDQIWQGEIHEIWESAFQRETTARTTPFGHPTVLKAWFESHPSETFDPFFMLAEHDDGRRAFHLFVRPRGLHARAPAKIMRSAGGDFLDYTEPVVLPGKDGNTTLDHGFWDALKENISKKEGEWFDIFEMPRVREDSLGSSNLQNADDLALSVRLDAYDSFEAYVARRSKKLRSHFRRTAKRLAELGEVRLRVFDPTEIEPVLRWIPDLVREKEKKYEVAGTRSLFETYLVRLAEIGMPSGLVRCSTLTVNERPVSWSLDFVLDKTFFAYVTSYDPEFSDFGVGHLHALHLVEAAFDEGLEVFDFLWGDERYKSRWTDGDVTKLYPVRITSTRALSKARWLTNKGIRKLGKLGKFGSWNMKTGGDYAGTPER